MGEKPKCDKDPTICRATDISPASARLTYPSSLRRTLNRCNLPAEALASLAYQLTPVALELDGVVPLHGRLLAQLDTLANASVRARMFQHYMRTHYLLDDPLGLGLTIDARIDRSRLDYLRVLRGWLFDPDGREAAVLKGWVESRFGLLTRFHRGPIARERTDDRRDDARPDDDNERESAGRWRFDAELAAGLYATAALESQIDLLYTYAQYELAHRLAGRTHVTLYRGFSGIDGMQVLERRDNDVRIVALNNLSSFSASRDRADEFGDHVVACDVPLPKILAHSHLLPGRLQGEDEYLVIGGIVMLRLLT